MASSGVPVISIAGRHKESCHLQELIGLGDLDEWFIVMGRPVAQIESTIDRHFAAVSCLLGMTPITTYLDCGIDQELEPSRL